jgi:DNA invertase Pin-like site-specific DNA recombinase
MRQDWYIGYCRASTEEQARDGATLAAQPYALRAWAEQRGVEIRLLFERGCSGKRGSKRPKLDAALAALHQKDGPAGLVVHRLDRLSRSTVDFGLWLEKAQKRGWRVVLLDLRGHHRPRHR